MNVGATVGTAVGDSEIPGFMAAKSLRRVGSSRPTISELPTQSPTSAPTFMDLDDPTLRRLVAAMNPEISELPTAVPTGAPTFMDIPTEDPAPLNPEISELPTAAPTGLPTFMDLPAAPLDPSISESPTETPTFAPSFMDLEGDVGLVSAEVLPVTNGPSAAPVALTDPASQLPGQGMELPTAAPIAAPLEPTISELPTQSPTSAPTFMDLEAETATPESIVDATLFEDYMQRLAAILSENKSCFADIVDTISLISSCHDAQTAITYYSPCVIEAVSDVDSFAVQTKTVCGFVGPKYFAEMNLKRWFPTSSSGSEWAPFSWSGEDEEGEQETQIGS